MNSKLKQLLEKIDYKNLFEASERRVEKILAEYRSEKILLKILMNLKNV